mmetsp:Transcript_18611/g.57219  ORF Transcript_18611/g.57219 Transcript_18611/m.57219 type:complete len:249 (-) Transcript_18611:1117-1863(-)
MKPTRRGGVALLLLLLLTSSRQKKPPPSDTTAGTQLLLWLLEEGLALLFLLLATTVTTTPSSGAQAHLLVGDGLGFGVEDAGLLAVLAGFDFVVVVVVRGEDVAELALFPRRGELLFLEVAELDGSQAEGLLDLGLLPQNGVLVDGVGRELGADEVFEALVELDVVLGHEGDGAALLAGASGAADAMDVFFAVRGDVVIQDEVDRGNVEAATGDVGGDEDAAGSLVQSFVRFEFVQRVKSFRLRHLAV